jgi:hypothetical protein
MIKKPMKNKKVSADAKNEKITTFSGWPSVIKFGWFRTKTAPERNTAETMKKQTAGNISLKNVCFLMFFKNIPRRYERLIGFVSPLRKGLGFL